MLKIWVCLTLAGAAFGTVTVGTQSGSTTVARKILFIGDSFTYAQGGINTHLEKLAAAATPPLIVTTATAVAGGAPLKRLWEIGEPVHAIQTGGYDVVVLQDDIPEINVAGFREYAHKFVDEVRKNKARPVLFMAWAYQRLGWISMKEIADAHRRLGKELNVDVAPVGLAWEQAARLRPSLDMYGSDREHPSLAGTYLATCVIYVTIYGTDPAGLGYVPATLSDDAATFLRVIAWQTVQEFKAATQRDDRVDAR